MNHDSITPRAGTGHKMGSWGRHSQAHQIQSHTDRIIEPQEAENCYFCRLKMTLFGRPFVKRFALCYQTVVCLSVTFVHCGQTVGRIKMKLGMLVGLGKGHILLDGDPARPARKGHSPHPIFGPYLLWPNGCMDQDASLYRASPQPRQLCVRWRTHFTLPKKGGRAPSSIFDPFLLRPNACMHQDATWYGGRPQPRGFYVRWDQPSPCSL